MIARRLVWSVARGMVLAAGVSLGLLPGAAGAEAAAEPRSGKVNATALNVRAKPATRYEVISQLGQGEEVAIVGEREGWYEIRAPGRSVAWIAAQYVGDEGKVTADHVRVHSGPGLVFTPYAFLDKGGQVTCIGSPREGWQRIGAPPGATGWVNSQYIVLQSPPHPADTVNTDTGPAQVEEVARPVPAAPPRPGAESRAAAADQAAIQAPPGLGLTPGNTAAAEETQEEPATTPTVEVVAEPQVQAAVGQAQQPAAAEQAQQPAAAGTQPDSSVRAEMLPPIAVNAPEQPLASVVPLPSPVPVPTAPPDPASAPAPVLVSPAPTPAADPAPVTGVGPVENLPPARVPLVQVRRDGVVVSLGAQSSSVATHYLGLAVGGTEYPVCYLHSTHLSLQEWERKEVRVYGNEVYYQGWKKPVIEVTGIQLRDP